MSGGQSRALLELASPNRERDSPVSRRLNGARRFGIGEAKAPGISGDSNLRLADLFGEARLGLEKSCFVCSLSLEPLIM